ncbi:uncharacterized protein LOC119091004 [Pollicipes pollicipes]|uniref:uncharacterized protein LOC119091004 n=1 Tax=Pollicipes pollicipes TaxID=41117 RepID=UPI001884E4B2|nr:uncharacterized protein LOC119091004 [Pollicipes pollicipes]
MRLLQPQPPAVNGVKTALLQRVRQLTRPDLETLVLDKMCESIACRSVIGEMKQSAEKHVTAAERFQKKITYLQKQVGDLHLVVRKLSAELKSRRAPSYPVKITRTVGLQVTLAKSVPPLTSRPRPAPGAAAATPAANGVLRAQLSSPMRPRMPGRGLGLPPAGLRETSGYGPGTSRTGRGGASVG